MNCAHCGHGLTYDEYGLNRKFNSGKDLLCISCLAKRLDVTEVRLKEKIEEFQRAGCLYFSRKAE